MIIPKISIFHYKSVYFENILRKNHSETSWFEQSHNALVYDDTVKHEIGVKSVR